MRLIAGLDIGSTHTRAVIGDVVEELVRPELRVLGVGSEPTAGVRRDAVVDLEDATASIRAALGEAELMAGASVDRVYVGVSGDHMDAHRSVGVVAVSAKEIVRRDVDRVHEVARAVPLTRDRELLHAIPQDYAVDRQRGIVDPVGMSGTRLETDLYLVTASASVVENITRAVEKAGYRVQDHVLEPLASARAVVAEDEKELGVAVIDLGDAATGFAVYFEGKIRDLRVLPVGGATLTSDLIRGLSIPFAEAKRVKELYGAALEDAVDPAETIDLPGANGDRRSVPRRSVAEIMQQRIENVFLHLRQRIQGLHPQVCLSAGIVIVGKGATIPGITDLACRRLAAPARVGTAHEGLSGLVDAVAMPDFAAAAGLALLGVDYFLETGEGASTATSGIATRAAAWLKEFF